MQHQHRRRALGGLLAGATASALLLTGCAPGATAPDDEESAAGDLTPVSIQLQWVLQGQFAGYVEAVEQGYFEDEGLDVTLVEAGTDTVPQNELANGNADYAVAWVPKVLGSIESGTDITDVAQIFQRSGTLQVSMADSGVGSVADLAGKNVGSWGFGNEWELYAGITAAGLDPAADVDVVQQAFDMEGLLSGDIDAAQAMTYNEYAQVLESENPDTGELYQPEDLNVINWTDEGVGMYQDALWADAGRLESDEAYQEQTVGVIKAVLRGWMHARDDVEGAAEDVVAAGSQLGASHQLWQTNEVNKLIWPSPDGIGMIDESIWDQTVEIARTTQNGEGATVISKDPPSSAWTNEYVEQALDQLRDEGEDVTGEDFEPIEVTLNPGGE